MVHTVSKRRENLIRCVETTGYELVFKIQTHEVIGYLIGYLIGNGHEKQVIIGWYPLKKKTYCASRV